MLACRSRGLHKRATAVSVGRSRGSCGRGAQVGGDVRRARGMPAVDEDGPPTAMFLATTGAWALSISVSCRVEGGGRGGRAYVLTR